MYLKKLAESNVRTFNSVMKIMKIFNFTKMENSKSIVKKKWFKTGFATLFFFPLFRREEKRVRNNQLSYKTG
jgi:hypothetical protein